MVNQVVLVGRLTADPQTTETENGGKVLRINIAVPRAYKNADGIYETDFIRCTMWNAVASSTCEYCHKGDIVGIRGRIQVNNYNDEDGNQKYSTEVVVDRVTFLSSKKLESEGEDDVEDD